MSPATFSTDNTPMSSEMPSMDQLPSSAFSVSVSLAILYMLRSASVERYALTEF